MANRNSVRWNQFIVKLYVDGTWTPTKVLYYIDLEHLLQSLGNKALNRKTRQANAYSRMLRIKVPPAQKAPTPSVAEHRAQ
jgi:hypothetical protein